MLNFALRLLFYASILLIPSTLIAIPSKNKFVAKRVIGALKIDGGIIIDGNLSEPQWEIAEVQSDFMQYEPISGSVPSQHTEIRVLYSNSAIYIGATLFDSNAANIYRELGVRDNSDKLKSDVFSVLLSPYNDGINYQEFMLSASGVQTDIRHTGANRDKSWDAVWESRVNITDKGWFVEMRIPFSALRFSNNVNGNWGINFRRLIKRYNEWSSWNPIDISISGMVNQSGELAGIANIESPVRLSFSPYISTHSNVDINSGAIDFKVNGGMDLKFGLSESFTLDLTLIPDFGQVKSDDKILNISPFEIMYDEQRPFFTEGMDLFSKGNIFYSRRIGSVPKFFQKPNELLNENEVVVTNPLETKMLNATKVSGRTGKGLGVGVFNALTSAAFAKISDTISWENRKIKTQGFTNYNILVFDQTLPRNSYVSIINTNLTIPDTSYSANVTATDFIVRDKNNMYSLQGAASLSQIFTDTVARGYAYNFSLNKTSGNYLFSLWHNTESKNYNPNDMGFLQNPNEFSNGVELGYKVFKPFWRLLNWSSWFGYSNSYLFSPRVFSRASIFFDAITTFTKSYHTIGFGFSLNTKDTHDYDEPKSAGQMVIVPKRFNGNVWTSSDYRKPLAIDTKLGAWASNEYNQKGIWASFSPRIRVNNKIFIVYELRKDFDFNAIGFAGYAPLGVYMGLRNVSTFTNTLNGLFAFSANSSINLRARHYWRWLEYSSYHNLSSDGSLSDPITNIGLSRNVSYSTFNIDLIYQWNFAPGSVLSVVWKNAVEMRGNEIDKNFADSFESLINSQQYNSFSFKVLYYLDYQSLRRRG